MCSFGLPSSLGSERAGETRNAAAGWRTLRELAQSNPRLDQARLDELISRAREQTDLLEELRVRAAARLIDGRP